MSPGDGSRRGAAPLLVFAALATAFHLYYLGLGAYRVVWYDEAVPGLMALQILRGEFPVFYWGAPYLGSLESLVAAGLFRLFGVSTAALRFSPLLFFAIYGFFLFKLGQRVTRSRFPAYIALFLAVPPLVLNEYSVSPIGGYIHTVALGTALLYLTSRLLEDDGRENRTLLYALFGLVAGVGFWTFLMIVPYIVACLFCLVLRERRGFFSARTLLAASAFLVGSLPFWVWNARNDFLTFGMKAGLAAPGALRAHLVNFVRALMHIMGSGTEWFRWGFDGAVWWIATATFVFAGLVLVLHARRVWFWLVEGIRRPGTLHLIAAALVSSAGVYLFSAHGRSSLSRYLLPLYSSIPLLLAHLFTSLSAKNRLWHLLFVPLLLSMTIPGNIGYIARNRANPYRGEMQDLLRFLGDKGITHAYAHSRVAQPISFESHENVVCADFMGFRNLEYLRLADAADAAAVAIVTHADLRLPSPADMEEQVKALTDSYRRETIGKYTVFYGFDMPEYAYVDRTPLIAGLSANSGQTPPALLADGNLSTVWKSVNAKGPARHEIVIELTREVALAKITLHWGRPKVYLDGGMEIEASQDGVHWREVKRVQRLFGPFQAFRGRPKLIENDIAELLFDPTPCRYVRISEATKGEAEWEIAEVALAERDGERRPLGRDEAAAALRFIGTSFVMAEPSVLADLERERGGRLRTVPPRRDEYGRIHDTWAQRFPAAGGETTFAVPASDRERIVRPLEARGIPREESRAGDLALLRVSPAAGGEPPPSSYDVAEWEARTRSPSPGEGGAAQRSWVYQGDIGETVALDGFLVSGTANADPAPFALSLSEDGRNWETPRARVVNRLFWTDYSLLEARAPGPATLLLDAPARARYVEVAQAGAAPEVPHIRFFGREPGSGPLDPAAVERMATPLPRAFAPDFPGTIDFAGKIAYAGMKIRPRTVRPGDLLQVASRFEAKRELEDDFSVFVHFTDGDGKILFQSAGRLSRPFERSARIASGEVILDHRAVEIPAGLAYRGKVAVWMGIVDERRKKRWSARTELPERRDRCKVAEIDVE